MGKQRKSTRQRASSRKRERLLEILEDRHLLAFDVVLGPGTVEPIVEVPAEIRLQEEERSTDTIDIRKTNNNVATAEHIPLGFDIGEYAALDVRGELLEPAGVTTLLNSECDGEICPEQVDILGNQIPPTEDGSIVFADTVNWEGGAPITYVGGLGDSVAAGNNDADFYEFLEVPAGEIITAHLQIGASGGITGALVVYNEFGEVMLSSDANNPFVDNDVYISYVVPEAGDYYVAVAGIEQFNPQPFVTPHPTNVGRVAYAVEDLGYTVTLGVSSTDIDFYAIDLMPGDILGANAIGAVDIISVFNTDGQLQYSTGQEQLGPPPSSPLPRGGSANAAYVADTAGTHYVAVSGFASARYLLELRLFRPPAESEPAGTRQILFLDFDGAELNPAIFDNPSLNTFLTPMREFIGNWGINSERALADAIIDVVDQDLNGDLQKINPDAGVIILNSYEHEDPWGQPNVSRIIIGGTQAQAGIPTVGIAESLDVGNFAQEETAFVLLDLLSEGQNSAISINSFPVAPGASVVELAAASIGGIVSHEAGHFYGAYHTDNANNVNNLMDSGGNLWQITGVGFDRIWGTSDDVEVSFVDDEFALTEGYVGIQNTGSMLANILISGQGIVEGSVQAFSGFIFNDSNGNGAQDPTEGGLANVRVYIDVNNDGEFGIAEPTAVTDESGTYQLPSTDQTGTIRLLLGAGQTLTSPEGRPFGVQSSIGDSFGTDYSSAPASYGSATHTIQAGVRLGSSVDSELAAGADAEDNGVSLSSVTVDGTGSVSVTATTNGFAAGLVNGWIDFNRDGRFDNSERILTNERLEGTQTYTFDVPDSAEAGETWARFRLGYLRDAAPTGGGGIGEVEDYAVSIFAAGGGTNPGGGNTETAPTAVSDSATLIQGASSFELNVLSNDAPGTQPVTITAVSDSTAGGQISVSDDGLRLLYTPAANFIGDETFTYTITSSAGSSSAQVVVTVEPDTSDPGGDLVGFRVEATDLTGRTISTVPVGGFFQLNVYVEDLRPEASLAGVFSAYVDVNFDEDLASPNGLVTFDPYFSFFQNPVGGDFSTVQEADNDLGGSTRESSGVLEEQLLMTIPMRANSAGSFQVTMDGPDNLPGREILLWPTTAPEVTESRIQFQSTSLLITETTNFATLTNPVDANDINNDGFVSARDALILIQAINSGDVGPIDSLSFANTGYYMDPSGDLNLTPRDVLFVITAINSQNNLSSSAAAEPPESLVASVVDSVFDLDDDDDDDDFGALGQIV